MKRMTGVTRWCVLCAAGALVTLGACVDEGDPAPPLTGLPGPVAPPPADGGAGASGMAGTGGGMGMGGSQSQGGQGGSSGAAGSDGLPDAGDDAATDAGDAG